MPSKGTTKRGIRIDDVLWDEFKDATEAAVTNPSETIRQLIREWIDNTKGNRNEDHKKRSYREE